MIDVSISVHMMNKNTLDQDANHIRVGFITPYRNNYGGGELFLDELVKFGNQKTPGSFLLFSSDPKAFSQEIIVIPDISSYKKLVFNLHKTISILKTNNVDIVIINDYYLSQFSLLFSHHFLRVFSLIHGEINHNRIKNPLLKSFVTHVRLFLISVGSSKILSVNKTNIQLYKRNHKVKYIGNFIAPSNYDVSLYCEKAFDFIFVGRLVREKNLIFLLEVFEEYRNSINSESNLIIIGDGYENTRIREHILEHGLEHSIELKGSVSHDSICEYYEKSRVLLLFSITEGFPTVILEALRFGVPCVVSDVGSNSDIIHNGINGYVFSKEERKESIVQYMNKAMKLEPTGCVSSVNHYGIDEFYVRFLDELVEL